MCIHVYYEIDRIHSTPIGCYCYKSRKVNAPLHDGQRGIVRNIFCRFCARYFHYYFLAYTSFTISFVKRDSVEEGSERDKRQKSVGRGENGVWERLFLSMSRWETQTIVLSVGPLLLFEAAGRNNNCRRLSGYFSNFPMWWCKVQTTI